MLHINKGEQLFNKISDDDDLNNYRAMAYNRGDKFLEELFGLLVRMRSGTRTDIDIDRQLVSVKSPLIKGIYDDMPVAIIEN